MSVALRVLFSVLKGHSTAASSLECTCFTIRSLQSRRFITKPATCNLLLQESQFKNAKPQRGPHVTWSTKQIILHKYYTEFLSDKKLKCRTRTNRIQPHCQLYCGGRKNAHCGACHGGGWGWGGREGGRFVTIHRRIDLHISLVKATSYLCKSRRRMAQWLYSSTRS